MSQAGDCQTWSQVALNPQLGGLRGSPPVVHLLCERQVGMHKDPTVTLAATSLPLAQCSFSLSDEVTAVGPREQSTWPEVSK